MPAKRRKGKKKASNGYKPWDPRGVKTTMNGKKRKGGEGTMLGI